MTDPFSAAGRFEERRRDAEQARAAARGGGPRKRCWHCGRLPSRHSVQVAEDAVEARFWCSTEERGRDGERLGCGASGPPVEDAYADWGTAGMLWDEYVDQMGGPKEKPS